jgi:nucleotide-binding universal stress UspA family protein
VGKILCASRGGEASRATEDRAIALAQEREDDLVFLFVADASFLNQTAAPLVVDVESRLVKMGRFQLTMARKRAVAGDVNAEVLVRKGRLQAELITAARELNADLIVLGRPVNRGAVFDEAALEAFASVLETQTGAEVRIL